MTWKDVGEIAKWPAFVLSLMGILALVLTLIGFEPRAAHSADVIRIEAKADTALAGNKEVIQRVDRVLCKLDEMQTGTLNPQCAR